MPNELNKEAAREAKHGEKMIEVKVRFWTDGIASGSGKVVPKNAWTSGVVRIDSNKSHGITPDSPVPFNSLLDVGAAIEKVLINHPMCVCRARARRMKNCRPNRGRARWGL